MGLVVIRFEYPHANDAIIARQRQVDSHVLVPPSRPAPRPKADRSVLPTFHGRAGRKKAKRVRLT